MINKPFTQEEYMIKMRNKISQLLLISCVSIFMCTAIFAAEKSTDKELLGNRGIGAKGYMVGTPPGEVPQTLVSPKMLNEEELQREQREEGGVTSTVKKNDSLWSIADRQYGDPNKWPVICLIFLVVVLLSLIIIKKSRQNDISTKLDEMYSKIHNDINLAVVPKSINLSPSTDDLIQFAVEVWRIEQRLAKLQAILPENSKKGLENSVQKLKRYFEKYDIEIIDYTNQKYNEGLNMDVLSIEKDPAVMKPIIKETVEPTIMYQGKVVRKAKIIVITNQN